jgi:nitronate monooxygenase
MDEVEARGAAANLGYPSQNALTRSLRTEAAKQNRPEFLSLWAGQGVRLARRVPAADLVRQLVDEVDATIGRLAARAEGHRRTSH